MVNKTIPDLGAITATRASEVWTDDGSADGRESIGDILGLAVQADVTGLKTTDSPQFAGINVGAASDTTITRVSAGLIAVEGDTVAMLAASQTLANKTLTSPTINGGAFTGGTDITVADGGTGRSSHTAYAVLCGGTSTTAAQQSVASVGTSGQVLTSNGAGALPTFQNASGGGSADDWDIVSSTSQSSPYTPTSLTGNTLIKITALANNLTLNVPTGTFGSSKRFYVQYQITASGGARTISLGTGMSLGQGVVVNLVIASGATLNLTFYTDDNGTSFQYDGDPDISKLASATPASGDLLWFADSSNSNALSQAPLLASESNAGIAEGATAAETNTGTDTARYVHPDGLAASYAGTKGVSLPLSALDTDNLATGDGQAWFVVPACLNGMNLVGIVGTVATAGSGGTLPTFNIRRVRSGSAVDMLSTALTIDLSETSSITAATAAVINTSNDDVQTGDLIKLDIDAVGSTPAKGGAVALEFRLP